MTIFWGAVFAAGVLLTISPWMWRCKERAARSPLGGGIGGRTQHLIEAAGFAATPAYLIAGISVGCAALGAAVVWVIAGVPAVAVLAGVAGGAAPVLWMRARARRRTRSRRALWPDICDLLIASVRAGMSLPDAVASLAESAPLPLRGAFTAFRSDLSASGNFDASVARLKQRLADSVADRIIETLRMARLVGGTELVPVLRQLSSSVRADAALRAEVEARQSWIRGAAVLGVAAPWVILLLLASRPEGSRAYSSPEGMILILVGAVGSVLAFRLMVRIGRLPEPRRWLG